MTIGETTILMRTLFGMTTRSKTTCSGGGDGEGRFVIICFDVRTL